MPGSPAHPLRLRQAPPPKETLRPIKTHKEHVAEMRGKMRDLGGAAWGEAAGLPRMRSVPSLSAGDTSPAKVFPRMLSTPSLSSGERRFSQESRRFSQEPEEAAVHRPSSGGPSRPEDRDLAPQLKVTWGPARGPGREKDRDALPAEKNEVAADSDPKPPWRQPRGKS